MSDAVSDDSPAHQTPPIAQSHPVEPSVAPPSQHLSVPDKGAPDNRKTGSLFGAPNGATHSARIRIG
jgi:hypothetical protein